MFHLNLPVIDLPTLAIIVSIISAGISSVAVLGYFLSRRNFQSESMLALFKIISDIDVKNSKKTLADEFLRCQDAHETPNFRNFKKQTSILMEAYNGVCALYDLNLIHRKHFEKVYGGNIVRTFNLSEKHIVSWLPNNNEYCKYFVKVSKELINKGYDKDTEVYRDIDK